MTDYKQVSDALATGAQPEMLCATCPWDRNCIQPPSMTRAEVEEQLDKARQEDKKAADEARLRGESNNMPLGSLMTAMVIGAADRSATICPVFAVRLRSSAGRGLVDGLKAQMQAINDNEVK